MNRAKFVMIVSLVLTFSAGISPARAEFMIYGDQDLFGFGYGGGDPLAGATLEGLEAGAVTLASNEFRHLFPFIPESGDFPTTDQIYAGSGQTTVRDGYSTFPGRIRGPQIVNLDYSTLIGSSETIESLTLGLAASDFQFPSFGQPFSGFINGNEHDALTATLNSLNQTGPQTQFFTIGIDPDQLSANNILSLGIDGGGNGGDGWAVDFLSVGVTTIPEPSTYITFLVIIASLIGIKHFQKKSNDHA